MKFLEWYEKFKKAMPAIEYRDGDIHNPGFMVAARIWNGFAIIFPEKCDDIIVFDNSGTPPYIAALEGFFEGKEKEEEKAAGDQAESAPEREKAPAKKDKKEKSKVAPPEPIDEMTEDASDLPPAEIKDEQ